MGASDFAEPREKRIAELEEQVSKLEKYARWWIEENAYVRLAEELNEEILNGV
jgi:regulator of replication initiation timing